MHSGKLFLTPSSCSSSTNLVQAAKSDCARYQALIEKHFTQAVVQNLPDRLSRLDESEMSESIYCSIPIPSSVILTI